MTRGARKAASLAPGAARRWARLAARLLRSGAGVSAVEFALLAPLLVLGAFATADAGRALYQKMMIQQALRAGAQSAMGGADESEIRTVLAEVAGENFALAGGTDQAGALSVDVAGYCGCPGQAIAQVSCTAACDSGLSARRFYELGASKTFQAIMLPDFTISGKLEVLGQ